MPAGTLGSRRCIGPVSVAFSIKWVRHGAVLHSTDHTGCSQRCRNGPSVGAVRVDHPRHILLPLIFISTGLARSGLGSVGGRGAFLASWKLRPAQCPCARHRMPFATKRCQPPSILFVPPVCSSLPPQIKHRTPSPLPPFFNRMLLRNREKRNSHTRH